MEDRSSYDYIKLGLLLRAGAGSRYSYTFANSLFSEVKELLSEVNFEVSLAMTDSEKFGRVEDEIKKKFESSPEEFIDSEERERLTAVFYDLEKVIFAESSTKKTYSLPARRYNTKYLLNSPDKLFKDGHFSKYSELARADIFSASKCLLFGEATASAFHILRATEDVLKSYYFHHRKQKRIPKPMWANMLDQLKAKKTNKPPLALLESLDLIRKNYRNPTQHPEALYTIDTAQDLFGVCLDVLGKMAEEL
ncbi:hypothetical protein FKQ62_12980 [Vibrio sp. B1-2]|uniref:hypothetical protein n=1 Tax=Vibrio sp. B1-2 TaxID=2591465 RepID=UPI001482CCAE|nr:hypothetical protein [Vibrio sp. B1-2]NNO00349.1 hypothetical protein [Vibrio sp. B1-2]